MALTVIQAAAWPTIRDSLPPAEFLLDPFIPARAKVIIHGPPSCGKSAFIWGAMNAIQRGEDYLGFTTKRANCLLVSPDMNVHEIKHRWGLTFEPAFDFLCVPPFDCTRPNFLDTTIAATVRTHVQEHNIGLVAFDALGGIHSGKSNKDDETADAVDRVLDHWLPGIGVALLHHDKKTRYGQDGEPMEPTDEDFLGSNKWRANATSQLHMWPQANHMSLLKHAKSQVSAVYQDQIKLYIDQYGRAELFNQARAADVIRKYSEAVSQLKLQGLSLTEQDRRVAEFYGKDERTVRRWRSLAKP
jgi:hypothetical protein